jgi:hypothetical protein
LKYFRFIPARYHFTLLLLLDPPSHWSNLTQFSLYCYILLFPYTKLLVVIPKDKSKFISDIIPKIKLVCNRNSSAVYEQSVAWNINSTAKKFNSTAKIGHRVTSTNQWGRLQTCDRRTRISAKPLSDLQSINFTRQLFYCIPCIYYYTFR